MAIERSGIGGACASCVVSAFFECVGMLLLLFGFSIDGSVRDDRDL